MSEMKAISYSDFEKYGCIKCGCDFCHSTGISGAGCAPVQCGECGEFFVILADGLNKSRIGFGGGDNEETVYPELGEHPRKDIPKHKFVLPDIRPKDIDGEYWSPRGAGRNYHGNPDISGFVKCKHAGERIVQMIEKVIGKKPESWLDYREKEPTWIQVKINSEDGFDCEKLDDLCRIDGIITEEKLRQALVA